MRFHRSGRRPETIALARAGQVVAICLLTAAGGAAQSTRAQPHCVPVGGSLTTNFLDEATTLGTATGDLQGAVSASLLGVAPGPNDAVVFTVQHHWVTAAGDTIHLNVARATAAPTAPDLFGIVSYPVSIAGGTGRFAGATGTLQNIGAVDLRSQRTVFRYEGTVCFSAPQP